MREVPVDELLGFAVYVIDALARGVGHPLVIWPPQWIDPRFSPNFTHFLM
jgi:hypothetical protein